MYRKFKVRIEDPPRRQYFAFLGGAVLADMMKDRERFWMTNEEYQEKGIKVSDRFRCYICKANYRYCKV